MSTTKTLNSFVQQVLARLKGDDSTVLATKIARKASSAVDTQIAALKAKQVDCEDALDNAKEALEIAKYPTEMITDSKTYIQGIQAAEIVLEQAKTNLEDVNTSIKYFEDLASSF